MSTSLSALRHRDFALFWTAALFSNSAAQMQALAVPIVVYDLTDSAAWVGLSGFCALVPSFVLTPFAGVLSDRLPRRLILLVTQSIGLLLSTLYAVLWYSDVLDPGVILLLQLMQGVNSGLQISAWQSFVPTLVPRESLLDAVRLNSIQFTTARALGPATAGVALALAGIGVAFVVNAVSFVPVLAVLVLVRARQPAPEGPGEQFLTALRAGARYVRARPALLVAVATGFMISFLGQSLAQFAAPVAEELYGRSGNSAKSNLVTAVGVGSVFASAIIIWAGDRLRRSLLAMSGLAVYAIGVVVVGLSTSYVFGLAGYFLTGWAHVCVAVATNTSIQIQVSERYRGRVLSIYLMGVLGGLPSGALLYGLVGDSVGLDHAIVGGGIVLALYGALAALRLDGFRGFDTDDEIHPEGERAAPPVLVRQDEPRPEPSTPGSGPASAPAT